MDYLCKAYINNQRKEYLTELRKYLKVTLKLCFHIYLPNSICFLVLVLGEPCKSHQLPHGQAIIFSYFSKQETDTSFISMIDYDI